MGKPTYLLALKRTADLQINKQKRNLALQMKSHACITPQYKHTANPTSPIISTQKHCKQRSTVHQGLHTKSIPLEEVDTYNSP
jgi:hypothetical protein